MAEKPCPREHDFALVIGNAGPLSTELMNRLHDVGCDDATASTRSGALHLTFCREAPTLRDAILGAIRDVRRAGVGLEHLRVDSRNLVTLSEIARRVQRSKQLVHQYSSGHRGPGGFPPPCTHINDRTPLWQWCEVASWLVRHNMIKPEALADARDVEMINDILDYANWSAHEPAVFEETVHALTV
jgi:hypothetical protein